MLLYILSARWCTGLTGTCKINCFPSSSTPLGYLWNSPMKAAVGGHPSSSTLSTYYCISSTIVASSHDGRFCVVLCNLNFGDQRQGTRGRKVLLGAFCIIRGVLLVTIQEFSHQGRSSASSSSLSQRSMRCVVCAMHSFSVEKWTRNPFVIIIQPRHDASCRGRLRWHPWLASYSVLEFLHPSSAFWLHAACELDTVLLVFIVESMLLYSGRRRYTAR